MKGQKSGHIPDLAIYCNPEVILGVVFGELFGCKRGRHFGEGI